MKKKLILFCLLITLLTTLPLFSKPIVIEKMPSNAEEFVSLRNKIANSPEGGAAIFVLSILKFSESEELGMQFLTIALTQDNLSKGNVYKDFKPSSSLNYHLDRFKSAGYFWGKGYVKGAKPDDGYKFSWPVTFEIKRNQYSGDEKSGTVKVFVDTFGVMARPITLKVNDKGLWKASEFSSFWLPVQAPKKNQSDDL